MTTHTNEMDVEQAACHLYEAEVALHAAHQTAIDEWITAAAERLHQAVLAYRRATASPTHSA